MPETTRPPFNAYSLPLPRRRQGPAAALSLAAHIAIAILVLWRGAELFHGGGGGGGRPAMSWFALPTPSTPALHDVPPAPAVTVPTVAPPVVEPVTLEVPPPTVTIAPASPAAVGTGEGTAGGPGEAPGTGGGKGTGTGTGVGSDSGPGSGGAASDIFGPTPLLVPNVPQGAPPEEKTKHEVRFWIRADGRVSRIEVIPPIRDSGYRRVFMESMKGFVFSPAKTRDGHPIDYVYSIVVYP